MALWRRGARAQQHAPHTRNARNPEPTHPARRPRALQVDPARWPPLQQLAAESGRALVVVIILALHLTYLLKLRGVAPPRRSRSSRQSIGWCAAAVSCARAPARILRSPSPVPCSDAHFCAYAADLDRRVSAGRASRGRPSRRATDLLGRLARRLCVGGSVGSV